MEELDLLELDAPKKTAVENIIYQAEQRAAANAAQ